MANEEKIPLSNKIIYTAPITVRHTAETNFVSKALYERLKVADGSSFELLKVEDVQSALNEFIDVVEALLVFPFEGSLVSDNKYEVEIHRKITDYNREKFNELKNKRVKEIFGERLLG